MGGSTLRMAVVMAVLGAIGAAPVRADPLGECWVEAKDQIEVRLCLERTLELSERALEAALAIATEALVELDRVSGRDEAVSALNTSQEQWRAFRDANCELRAKLAGGGTGAGTFQRNCRITMTRQRADELARLASDGGYPLP